MAKKDETKKTTVKEKETKEAKKQETTEEKKSFFVVEKVKKITSPVMTRVRNYNEKYGKKIVDTAGEFRDEVRKDAKGMIDRVRENAKNYRKKFTVVETVENKIERSWNSVRDRVNLPCREDIEKLASAMKDLDTKVEALNKKLSA